MSAKIYGADKGHQLRHECIITASDFKNIITEKTQKPSSSIEVIAKEKAILHLKTIQEINNINEQERNVPFYGNDMMRGNALETDARKAYEIIYNMNVETIGFVTTPCGKFGYSPDGFVGEDGLLEIKSPCFVKHYKYIIDDEVPSEYMAQLQGGLMITGRKWIDLVLYNEFAPMFPKRVFRNEQYIKNIQDALQTLVEYYDIYTAKLQSLKVHSVKSNSEIDL